MKYSKFHRSVLLIFPLPDYELLVVEGSSLNDNFNGLYVPREENCCGEKISVFKCSMKSFSVN